MARIGSPSVGPALQSAATSDQELIGPEACVGKRQGKGFGAEAAGPTLGGANDCGDGRAHVRLLGPDRLARRLVCEYRAFAPWACERPYSL